MSIDAKGAHEIAHMVNSGTVSVREVANHFAVKTENSAQKLNSHSFFDKNDLDKLVSDTESYLQEQWQKGNKPKLAGVPFLIKDNISRNDFLSFHRDSAHKLYSDTIAQNKIKGLPEMSF